MVSISIHWRLIILGYPAELKGLLFHRPNLDRVSVAGYEEEGTTTTPFSMMLCNHTSRFDVALAAVRGAKGNQEVQVKRQQLLAGLDRAIHKANVFNVPASPLISRNMRCNTGKILTIAMRFPNFQIGSPKTRRQLPHLVTRLRNFSSIRV
jgi:hypothetical protein